MASKMLKLLLDVDILIILRKIKNKIKIYGS